MLNHFLPITLIPTSSTRSCHICSMTGLARVCIPDASLSQEEEVLAISKASNRHGLSTGGEAFTSAFAEEHGVKADTQMDPPTQAIKRRYRALVGEAELTKTGHSKVVCGPLSGTKHNDCLVPISLFP